MLSDRINRIKGYSAAVLVAGSLLAAGVGSAYAGPVNEPPPAGAILDLSGTSIPTSYQQYSVNFTANVANTAITFAFRDDPDYIYFSNPSLVDTTTSSSNLLINSTFTAPVHTSNGNTKTPSSWTYANIYGADAGGQQYGTSNCHSVPVSGSNCWVDGAVQAYDAISQTVGTTVGDSYTLSFYAYDNSGNPTYSRLSTNGDVTNSGGNGINILAYAQSGLPAAASVPEPPTLPLLGVGLLAMAAFAGRRRTRQG